MTMTLTSGILGISVISGKTGYSGEGMVQKDGASVSTGLWIGTGGTVRTTYSSALLPADDEPDVVLSYASGRFTMRSVCTGAAGTGATSACKTLGGVAVDNEG
ncbi:hypothetical protein BDR07DRAFT_1371989 [Suillus spraguei]|nr:hypothetical protein BDR07DRAFT_1371989 [Suillus spraguei]